VIRETLAHLGMPARAATSFPQFRLHPLRTLGPLSDAMPTSVLRVNTAFG